jgi:hypothetical protein
MCTFDQNRSTFLNDGISAIVNSRVHVKWLAISFRMMGLTSNPNFVSSRLKRACPYDICHMVLFTFMTVVTPLSPL